MATDRPRITVTLRDDSHAALRAASDATGQSMSQLVSSLVEVVTPSLWRVAEAHDWAAQAEIELMDGLAGALSSLAELLDPPSSNTGGRLTDGLVRDVSTGSENGPV